MEDPAARRRGDALMPTMEHYATLPLETRLARLSRTPDEIRAAIDGHADAPLARRPAPASWSATEIICHLRDVEELFLTRFQTFLAMEEPKILAFGAQPEDLAAWGIGDGVGNPLDPDRWAEDRQYGRSDGRQALAARRHPSDARPHDDGRLRGRARGTRRQPRRAARARAGRTRLTSAPPREHRVSRQVERHRERPIQFVDLL